jgi:hypothetical protein
VLMPEVQEKQPIDNVHAEFGSRTIVEGTGRDSARRLPIAHQSGDNSPARSQNLVTGRLEAFTARTKVTHERHTGQPSI